MSQIFNYSLSTWIGLRHAKMCLRACAKCSNSDSSHACAKYHSGICSPLIHSIVSSDSVSGLRRPWSDYADAQADLGLRCPHMPEDIFSHDAVLLEFILSCLVYIPNYLSQTTVTQNNNFSCTCRWQVIRACVFEEKVMPCLYANLRNEFQFYIRAI